MGHQGKHTYRLLSISNWFGLLACLLAVVTALMLAGCSGSAASNSTQTAADAFSSSSLTDTAFDESKVPEAAPSEPEPEEPQENRFDNLDDNAFLDALAYLGYNLDKQRSDGMMWDYVLWTDKEWRGWLSKVTYGDGSTGFETTSDGKPDVAAFEAGGLVCASYATYVYFNYLPNVEGVDVSKLARPERSYSADSVFTAAKQWVNDGYSRYIDFSVSESNNWLSFSANEDIPIGSLIFFCDAKNRSDTASHVCVYAGYASGEHWVTHVGNKNGPEFCAVERMHYGDDPQWPIAIITRPF